MDLVNSTLTEALLIAGVPTDIDTNDFFTGLWQSFSVILLAEIGDR